jgi:hypothetical protein
VYSWTAYLVAPEREAFPSKDFKAYLPSGTTWPTDKPVPPVSTTRDHDLTCRRHGPVPPLALHLPHPAPERWLLRDLDPKTPGPPVTELDPDLCTKVDPWTVAEHYDAAMPPIEKRLNPHTTKGQALTAGADVAKETVSKLVLSRACPGLVEGVEGFISSFSFDKSPSLRWFQSVKKITINTGQISTTFGVKFTHPLCPVSLIHAHLNIASSPIPCITMTVTRLFCKPNSYNSTRTRNRVSGSW